MLAWCVGQLPLSVCGNSGLYGPVAPRCGGGEVFALGSGFCAAVDALWGCGVMPACAVCVEGAAQHVGAVVELLECGAGSTDAVALDSFSSRLYVGVVALLIGLDGREGECIHGGVLTLLR